MRPGFVSRALDAMFGRLAGGGVEGGLGRLLKSTHLRRQQNVRNAHQRTDELYSDEASAAIEVINTLAKADQKAGAKLRGPMNALVRTAHHSVRCWSQLAMLRDHPQWKLHRRSAHSRSYSSRSDEEYTETFDPNRALVSWWSLLAFETALTVVEIFFWYAAFTSDLDRNAGWADPVRIGAILIALFLPGASLIGARLAGGLAHRWVMDYQGISKRRHSGALVALLVFGLLLTAIFLLVLRRFDESTVAIGSVAIPAAPMAMIFAGALMADAAVRTYMASEIREQYRLRAKEFTKLRNKLIKANQAHLTAWTTLRRQVQHHRDQAARIETAGAGLLTRSEASWGDPHTARSLPESGAGLQDAQPVSPGTRPRSALRLPNPRSLNLFGEPNVLAPSRCLEDAADVLLTCRAWDPEALAAELQDLWEDLHYERPRDGHTSRWSGGPTLKAS